MSRAIGVDPALSAFRWQWLDEVGNRADGVMYLPLGCPPKIDSVRDGYRSRETWGNSLGFRRHVFTPVSASGGAERTTDLVSPQRDWTWLSALFAGRETRRRLPVDPTATLTVAVADHASLKEQDACLDAIPSGYRDCYLLWRPIAMVLAWMEGRRRAGLDDAELLTETILTVDLDGPRPELAEIGFRRHDETGDVIPLHKRPRRAHVARDDMFEALARKTVLGHVPEYEQLFMGQFASEIQAKIESDVADTDVWVRVHGAWKRKRIDLLQDLDVTIWQTYINGLLQGDMATRAKLKTSTVLVNGWSARRFERQLTDGFQGRCKSMFVLPADSIAEGCAIFSLRRSRNMPTYYDYVPQYEMWISSALGFRWLPLFRFDKDYVEPGCTFSTDQSPRLVTIERNSDNVSVYIRPQPESENDVNPDCLARRLKVNFGRFQSKETNLLLTAHVAAAKGAAVFRFAMFNPKEGPLFLRKDKPVRDVEFRYTEESNTEKRTEITEEPLHKGYLEPQPVLGCIYDDEFPYFELLKTYNDSATSSGHRRLFREFQEKFTARDAKFITSRVGYHANPSEPTRGLFGTRFIASKDAENCETQRYVTHLWRCLSHGRFGVGDSSFQNTDYTQFNYCHCAAPGEYKAHIRSMLERNRPASAWSFYYAPGYVLGDDFGDVRRLLGYILTTQSAVGTTPKLWWSLFRMLCWHPESKFQVEDLPLVEDGSLAKVNATKSVSV